MADAPDSSDPLGELMRQLMAGGSLPPGLENLPGMPQDPAELQAMLSQVQHLLRTSDDKPVNWSLAHDVARQTAADQGDASIAEHEQRAVAESLRTADLWLDRVTDLRAASART